MFKMSAFSIETGQQTTPALVNAVVHNKETMTYLLRHWQQFL